MRLFGIFFGVFGGGDASGHCSRRPRDGAGHIIVFKGCNGGLERDVTSVGSIVRYIGRNTYEIRLRNVIVIRQSRRNLFRAVREKRARPRERVKNKDEEESIEKTGTKKASKSK